MIKPIAFLLFLALSFTCWAESTFMDGETDSHPAPRENTPGQRPHTLPSVILELECKGKRESDVGFADGRIETYRAESERQLLFDLDNKLWLPRKEIADVEKSKISSKAQIDRSDAIVDLEVEVNRLTGEYKLREHRTFTKAGSYMKFTIAYEVGACERKQHLRPKF